MKNLILFVSMIVLTVSACKSTKDTVVDEAQQTADQRRPDNPNRGNRGGGDRTARVDQMFARMDANSDGKLDKTEVQGPFAERFSTIDTNSDGVITKEEMLAAPRPERGRRPGGF